MPKQSPVCHFASFNDQNLSGWQCHLELMKLAKFKDKKAASLPLQIHFTVIYFLTLSDLPVEEKHKTFPCPTSSLLAQRNVLLKSLGYLIQYYLCFWQALTFFANANMTDGLKAKPRGWSRQNQTPATFCEVASAVALQGKFVQNLLASEKETHQKRKKTKTTKPRNLHTTHTYK